MKKIKRLTIYFFLISILVFSFRGCIYRNTVAYKIIGTRTNIVNPNKLLISEISIFDTDTNNTDIKKIIEASLKFTSNKLDFTTSKCETNPNTLIKSHLTHCVGYSEFFTCTFNHIINRHRLSSQWIAIHQIGKIYVFNYNIHNLTNSQFFKDHDFVLIENRISKERFAIDPSLNDYFMIDFVTLKK